MASDAGRGPSGIDAEFGVGIEKVRCKKCQTVMQRYGMERDLEDLAKLMRCPQCQHKQRVPIG